jgi:hypothetical protein
MAEQANVFDAFGKSYNALQGAWDQRTRNQAGRAYAAGDMAGATNALASGGMLEQAGAMRTQMRADEGRTRGASMTGALRSGDYAGARAFAQTPEELAGVQTFMQNASTQEVAQAQRRAGNFVSVLTSIGSIQDPAQRLAAARQQAPMFGLDPNTITADQVSPEFLEAQRMQALGLVEYLNQQREQEKMERPMFSPFGVYMPRGTTPNQMGVGEQPEYVDRLPPGVRPRPNQPSSAPAVGGGERNQPVGVSFRSSQEADSVITNLIPGVRVTSGARSPADNRRVGGAANSFHLQDRARDLVPPAGMTVGQLAAKLQQAGFRTLNEGNYVHVSW